MPIRTRTGRRTRSLQHQTLPASTRYGIDTEVWFRTVVAERAAEAGETMRRPTKDEFHDEAVAWFLERHAEDPPEQYPARRATDEDVTFWVDSKLMERARAVAARHGVKPARLLDAALTLYVRQHVPAELLEFRRKIQEEAARLYEVAAQRSRRAKARLRRRGA
jgi:hypothetical protein